MEETTNTEIVDVPAKMPRPATVVRHREIISRMVYQGQTTAQIAEELGISRGGLQAVLQSPMFQVELQKELSIKARIDRDSAIQRVASVGVAKLEEAVTTGKFTYIKETDEGSVVVEKVLDGRDIIDIIHDALDRSGHKPVNRNIEAHVDLGSMVVAAHKDAKNPTDDEVVIEAEIVNE